MQSNGKRYIDAKTLYACLFVMILITDLAVFLNIPIARQVLGFLFLLVTPGLVMILVLKLDRLGFAEKFVIALGLSVFFIMVFGLAINHLLLSLNYQTPLETTILLLSFNLSILILAAISFSLNKEARFTLPTLSLDPLEKMMVAIPLTFPILSIFGMYLMNGSDNNILLIILLLLIPLYVVLACFFNKRISENIYPISIVLISASLLMIYLLRFSHIFGRDVHTEYYLFKATLDELRWRIFEQSTLDACLSISLLPAIFQSISRFSSEEMLFRTVYFSICTFSPLIVYLISKKYLTPIYAFLA
jgi:uncharacterized membrane protein